MCEIGEPHSGNSKEVFGVCVLYAVGSGGLTVTVTVVVVWFSGFGNPGWMEGRWEVVSGRSGRASVCGGAFWRGL